MVIALTQKGVGFGERSEVLLRSISCRTYSGEVDAGIIQARLRVCAKLEMWDVRSRIALDPCLLSSSTPAVIRSFLAFLLRIFSSYLLGVYILSSAFLQE